MTMPLDPGKRLLRMVLHAPVTEFEKRKSDAANSPTSDITYPPILSAWNDLEILDNGKRENGCEKEQTAGSHEKIERSPL